MCTLAVEFAPDSALPLLVAANRDEALDRPATGPALREGPIRFIAPRDEKALGTWLGMNGRGLFVGITNRFGQRPDPARLSRGALVWESLAQPSAEALHRALSTLDVRRYNPFHLLYADRSAPSPPGATATRDASSSSRPDCTSSPSGASMLSLWLSAKACSATPGPRQTCTRRPTSSGSTT